MKMYDIERCQQHRQTNLERSREREKRSLGTEELADTPEAPIMAPAARKGARETLGASFLDKEAK